MSWKSADASIRSRLVKWSTFGSGVVTLVAAITILAVSHSYLYGRVDDFMGLILNDLRREYVQFGGLGDDFRHCIDDDIEEHDVNLTYICLAAPNGQRLYSSPELKKHSHEIVTRTTTLSDGNTITIVRDTEDIHLFLRFLAITLASLLVVSVALSGLGAYLIGGRILRLNDLMADKDRAYAELRHLTDDIAHDLRTPLTRLSMAAETSLADRSRSDGLADHVMNETRSMLELINTMLAISQTEAKIDRSPRETVDLADFLRGMGELYAPVAEDAGIKLTLDVPSEGVDFSGHKGKLQQLVGNLLDNAVKFTPAGGGIAVKLRHDRGDIRLSVSDTGCGIAASDLPFVFNRFWRADSSRHLQGNGLGLALAKAIAVSYGGGIVCNSVVGKGSKFVVTLPQSTWRIVS